MRKKRRRGFESGLRSRDCECAKVDIMEREGPRRSYMKLELDSI